jgi:putative glutamine amidotransferase
MPDHDVPGHPEKETYMSRRPTIGVCAAWDVATWSFWRQPAALVAATYIEAVRGAGGLPVTLLPQALTAEEAEDLLDRVDGLLLIGGADVDPSCYGEERSDALEATTPIRDAFELALVTSALERDLPILGICRGLQVLNAATGGTLHQDLVSEGYDDHRRAPGRLDAPSHHSIEVMPGTSLSPARESATLIVNSHHHQGVAQVGAGGAVVARSVADGAVEAVEWPEYRHVLGVQWHPESLDTDTTLRRLVDAARHHRLPT